MTLVVDCGIRLLGAAVLCFGLLVIFGWTWIIFGVILDLMLGLVKGFHYVLLFGL